MAINVETIGLDEGESFRVLRWKNAVDDVELLGFHGEQVPLRGLGSLWHLHEELELTFVAEGSGTRCVGDQISSFETPSLVLLGSNLPHYWRFSGRSSGLCVQLNPSRLALTLPPSARGDLHRLSKHAEKGLLYSGKVLARAVALLDELPTSQSLTRMGILFRLLGELGSASGSSAKELSTKRFNVSHLAPGYEQIQKAVLLILAHFNEDLALERVLKTTHMSKANFSRHFVAYTGRTYTQFLNDVRIDRACQMLAETGESIMDIAFASGFNNLSHFNRTFRQRREMSPTEYRLESGATAMPAELVHANQGKSVKGHATARHDRPQSAPDTTG